MRAAAYGKTATTSPTVMSKLRGRAWQLVRLVVAVLLFPIRTFLSVRSSMTAASVTLLLIGIITLNIIWGFPWLGMFSVCTALLFGGFIINRLMRPRLRVNLSLPNSAPADHAFTVVTHVENRRRIPAMDLTIRFEHPSDSGRAYRHLQAAHWSPTPDHQLALIRPSERKDLPVAISSERRGIHELPDLVVFGLFPFYLFRYTVQYPTEAVIAITPRPISGDEDDLCRGLLNNLGDWTHRLLAGDALDYTGSREYEVGMPVRSWDFRSWARLGKPIVREFQSPSIQMVTLLIDMSLSNWTASTPSESAEPEVEIERVLSLAASAVNDLTRKMVRICLYVSSESPSLMSELGPTQTHQSDAESLLIRLAAAEHVTSEVADQRIDEVIPQLGGSPGLIVTARRDHPWQEDLPANVSVLCVAEGAVNEPRDAGAPRSESQQGHPLPTA